MTTPGVRGIGVGHGHFFAACAAFGAAASSASAQVTAHLTAVGGANNAGGITAIAFPPGRDGETWFTTQTGRIYRATPSVRLPSAPLVQIPVNPGSEAGLLGLTFAPDFATSGRLFVMYNYEIRRPPAPLQELLRVSEFRYDPANSDTISLASERPIIELGASTLHNGGWIAFGPDGMFYISRGDGGNDTQPQNLANFYGKILRIDVNGDDFPADAGRNYAILAGNPFPSAPEIWLYGLRNPWRCSFDRETGDLWIGDVGQSRSEEINVFEAGATPGVNFGWPCYEGNGRYWPGVPCENPTGMTPPHFDLGRAAGNAVIGGYVYRGEAMPRLRGTYIFGSAYGQDVGLWNGANFRRINMNRPTLTVTTLAEDPRGELYVAGQSNTVYRLDCVADYNGDRVVDMFDLLDFYECFDGACRQLRSADLNLDGRRDDQDIGIFFDFFEHGC